MPRYIQETAAVDALVAAAESVGLEARSVDGAGADAQHNVVIVLPGGPAILLEVKASSLVTADSVRDQLARWSSRSTGDVTGVVVADRITADAKEILTRSGWSWLDLRGHLRLLGHGLFVDSDVGALAKPGADRSALAGQVGMELAAQLLLDPTKQYGVRAAAAALSRAPSSVSEAFGALRAAGLVDGARRPAVPELFWELAERWKPVSQDLATLPGPGRKRDTSALRLGLDDVESTSGWALTDTIAAAVLGASVAMRADYPRDFYVPDQSTLRRAVQLLGAAPTSSLRAGRVRVAPVPAVCAHRVDATSWANEMWPLANPLFVALDIAQDPGRGREILQQWTPREPWHRVW